MRSEHAAVAATNPWQRPAWHARAACRGMPPAWWFPVKEPHSGGRSPTRRAREVCIDCPVRLLCQEQAVRDREVHGVWGGLTAKELRRIRAQRRAS